MEGKKKEQKEESRERVKKKTPHRTIDVLTGEKGNKKSKKEGKETEKPNSSAHKTRTYFPASYQPESHNKCRASKSSQDDSGVCCAGLEKK